MENNTANYTEYTFPKLLEQYDMILVPMIQRDYAQGREDKKAKDVRNNLLTDIFISKEVHFDLVFGSKEQRIVDSEKKSCFIPVDGQQRLTTLFLLYLYGQKQKNLYQNLQLSKFSYDTRRAASSFCKCITSQDWECDENIKVSDKIKDSSWFMEYWGNDPTVAGMLNMLDAIHEKCRDKEFPRLEKVTFYFFDLESNGLNENLYLKMNSRGKPLTAFENLKAKIEKVLPDKIEIEKKCFPECEAAPKDSFKEKWKYFMDRNWTETFWDIEHPEKYDVYIAEFIVRFLSGYWAAYSGEEEISDKLKEINSKNSYGDYIPFEPIEKVLNLENAFPKLAYALTTLIDDSKIKPYWSKESDKIKISEKSDYKIIVVVLTYVLFDGDKSAMRFAWNMAENYVTGYDTYVAYCKRVKEIYNNKDGVYQTLSNKTFNNPSEQLKEEIAKAKQILDVEGKLRKYKGNHKKVDGSDYNTWEEIINEAEKYAFFKGSIRFLFTNEKGIIDWNEKDFDTKWENAQICFDDEGVKKERLVDTMHCLFSYCDDWDTQLWWSHKIFNGKADTWKNNILTYMNDKKHVYASPIHHILMGDESRNSDEIIDKRIQKLANPSLIAYVLEKNGNKREMYIRWPHYALHFYREKQGVLLDYPYRDESISKILKDSRFSLRNDIRIPNINLLWGFDIDIVYTEGDQKYNIRWYREHNNQVYDIYIMDEEWNYKHRDKELSERSGDAKSCYCFNLKEDWGPDTVIQQIINGIKELSI